IVESALLHKAPCVTADRTDLKVEVTDPQREPALARRRQRRPSEVAVALAPRHPGRGPMCAGYPDPAVVRAVIPVAVVIDGPAERRVGHPRPADVGPDPVAIAVRTPIVWNVVRRPDPAIGREADPFAIWGEGLVKVALVKFAGVLVVVERAGRRWRLCRCDA